MNTAYYEKMLNNVIYMEVLLVVLTAVNRIYQNVTGRSLQILDMLVEAGLALFLVGAIFGAAGTLAAHIRQEMQVRSFVDDPVFERIEGAVHGWKDSLLFQARHVLLDAMIYCRVPGLSGSRRKKLYGQIKEIAALDLWREDYHNVTIRRVLIREGAVYLLYDTDEGRTDCYRTRRGLISEDYRKLYDILEKNMVLRFDDVIEAEKIDKT